MIELTSKQYLILTRHYFLSVYLLVRQGSVPAALWSYSISLQTVYSTSDSTFYSIWNFARSETAICTWYTRLTLNNFYMTARYPNSWQPRASDPRSGKHQNPNQHRDWWRTGIQAPQRNVAADTNGRRQSAAEPVGWQVRPNAWKAMLPISAKKH